MHNQFVLSLMYLMDLFISNCKNMANSWHIHFRVCDLVLHVLFVTIQHALKCELTLELVISLGTINYHLKEPWITPTRLTTFLVVHFRVGRVL